MLYASFLAAAVFAGAPVPATIAQAAAQPAPRLSLPIACNVHVDCWIVKYFDTDPGPGARDYTGGSRTNDKHNGTDFAVRDLAAMNAGVPVLAAAEGTVRGWRDGMDDVNVRTIGLEAVKGRECGNGVLIDHASGWATQYCHMRKGSVRVRKGQAVKTGDVIGLVGQSGLAEFPHVHLSVFRAKEKIDPFSPGAGGETAPLWSASARPKLDYRPVSIFAAGIGDITPDETRIDRGDSQNQRLSATAPVIFFWSRIIGVRQGDKITQTLRAPGGRVLAEREIVQEKNQIRRFLWIGKKRGARPWPAGDYIGRTTVTPADGGGQGPYIREVKIPVAR